MTVLKKNHAQDFRILFSALSYSFKYLEDIFICKNFPCLYCAEELYI